MATRNPNTGPYVVTCTTDDGKTRLTKECHTWANACAYMRYCLICNHKNVTVSFT